MKDAALVLKNAEYRDTRVLQLLEKASNGQDLEYPNPRIGSLMGDSGVGKSSLINSLLDTPKIALSGANGEACTNVITEYHQAQPSQKAPFMAEIVLFESHSVQRILKTHPGSYYDYVHGSFGTVDQEAIDESNAHLSTALETFQAFFVCESRRVQQRGAYERAPRAGTIAIRSKDAGKAFWLGSGFHLKMWC